MKVYSFEKSGVWRHERKLAVWIYLITKKSSVEEKFGLVTQMRRAAISFASNLAEGTSRKTAKDQSHFSTMAYSSTIELLNDLVISNDLSFLSETIYNEGRNQIERQAFLIAQLHISQQKIK